MGALLLETVQESTKPRHKRGLDAIEDISRHRDKDFVSPLM